ncbi:MAG: leucine-rich repeat protein [Clostridia bacterium]|nr:leucine-rich repeat protein [Clostridia bacterium]
MKRTSKMIMAAVIVAVLLLGVGYAAIQNITLNINGTAAADPSQSNFKVMFSGTPIVSDETYVTAAVTDDTNATINVEGLTKKGDVVTATYTVQNASTDLSADLAVATTNNNTEFFTLSSELAKTSLIAGEATTLTVTVELTKTPITESVSATIGVQLEAMPVQPGEEGTSDGINGSSQTPEKIPEGAMYGHIDMATVDESIHIEWYDVMPEKITEGDLYLYGDYFYLFEQNGWWVMLAEEEFCANAGIEYEFATDTKQTSYGPILESINGEFVTGMEETFYACTELKSAPKIPDSVTNMHQVFDGCTSLTTAPTIPSGVTKMHKAFRGCTSLTTAPEIPSGVADMSYTFEGCTSLTGEVIINANPTSYDDCFSGVDFAAQILTLGGESNMLAELGATGTNY